MGGFSGGGLVNQGLANKLNQFTGGSSNTSQILGASDSGKLPLPAYSSNYQYANANAFNDPNQSSIFNAIQQGMNRSSQNAPTASLVAAGQAAQAGGAQISPQQMINGANINTSVSGALQNGQSSFINQLNQEANGQGPNLAGLQAQQTSQQNVLAQLGVLASQNGSSNPALAQRAAQNNAATASQGVAQTAATAEMQQQLQAQSLLGQNLTSANSLAQQSAQAQANLNQQAALSNQAASNTASLQQAGLTQNQMQANQSAVNSQNQLQAQMDQQTGLANLSSQQQQNQLNDQEYNATLGAYMGQSQQDVSNNVAYQQMMQQSEQANESLQANQNIANQQGAFGLAGSSMSALGTVGSVVASDIYLKKNIKTGNRPMRNFLNALMEQNYA